MISSLEGEEFVEGEEITFPRNHGRGDRKRRNHLRGE
jgi:hypothetical protein